MSDLSRKAWALPVKFTDAGKRDSNRYSLRRFDFILAGAGHLLILAVGLIAFSSRAEVPAGDGDAMMVTMVSAASASGAVPAEAVGHSEIEEAVAVIPEEIEEIQEEVIIEEVLPEEIQENPENPDEIEPQEIPEEIPEEIPSENLQEEIPAADETFASVSGGGSAGAGAPGPGTYESRVFNAVRRGYRTSVAPERSYRIILTVNTDGSTTTEIIRKSGTSAFDRAVENALVMAQIPPMPPGRNSPAVINIEFLGPEQ